MTGSFLQPTAEQTLFRNSVDKLLADQYPFDSRQRHAKAGPTWSKDGWNRLSTLGVLGFSLPEEFGGLGSAPVEMMAVMEAMGRNLVPDPFIASSILAAGCVELAGSASQQEELLPALGEGSLIMALAHAEPGARHDLSQVETVARATEGGWVLDGEKFLVLGGDVADRLVVSARIGAGDEIGLFLVDATAPGVERKVYRTQDSHGAANIVLRSVPVAGHMRLAARTDGLAVVSEVVDRATAAVCAEAAGLMQEMLDLTVEYLKTREQFGVRIGTFQSLQHRAADMFVAVDQARSMALGALAAIASADPAEGRKMVSAAKVQIGRSARFVGQQAIQLHGGIGVTLEHKVGHCFLRTTAIELLFGDAEHHLARLAEMGGLVEAYEQ
jgi:alkylation response protein AidB-like acyl-CoA dehydrogenase